MRNFAKTGLTAAAAALFGTAAAYAAPADVCKGVTLNMLLETVPDSTALMAIAPDFEALSGAKLNMEAVNYSLMHEKLVPSLTASSGSYDVLAVDSYWVGEFVTAKWIQPLDERIAKDGVDMSVYFPALLDINGHVKGTTYMLPFWQYAMGLLYRKDVVDDPAFQAAYKEKFGRDWRLPESLEEYADLAKWAKEYTGKGSAMSGQRADPVVMEASNYVFSEGADFYNRETWEPALGSPEGIKAVTIYADLLKNAAQPGALGANFDDVANALKQDKAIFAISYLFLMPTLQDPKESLVVDKMAFARMPGQDSLLGAWGWAIPTNAPNADCSWEFIKWVESKDIALKRGIGGGQPTQTWIYENADFLAAWPAMSAVGDALAHAKGLPVMSRATQLVEVFAEVMGDVLANGADPATAIAGANDKFARLVKGDPLLK